MERYSTLYGAHTIVNASGKEINQYIEISRSAGLDDFLRKQNIPNPTLAVEDVNATLTGFVKLPGYDEQPAAFRPMLVRYAPMHLKRLSKYDNNVVSFNSIACSAPDHQEGNRDGKYRNTHYIDRSLLLNGGEYNYLDQIFGTHLVTWKENQDVREFPIDHDAPPMKVQPAQNDKDAILVQMAAAALCNKATVILKLEKGCIFQIRSMELLKQIYALLAPIQAAEIGFASYESPANIPQLVADTTIRMFVIPAEAELGALENQSNVLVLDLNRRIKKPTTNELLKAVSVWYKIEWRERAQIMNMLFADMIDPNDVEGYVERSQRYKEAAGGMTQTLKDNRDKIETLSGLKALHDSFGILMNIPILHEKFCLVAPRLMKLPQQYGKKTKGNLNKWLTDELVTLGADAVMEKNINAAKSAQKSALYEFCCDVFKLNLNMDVSNEVGRRSVELTTNAVTAKKDAEFEEERKAMANERAEFKKKLDNAVNDEKRKAYEAVMAERGNTAKVEGELAQERRAREQDRVDFDQKLQDTVKEEERKRDEAVKAERGNTERVQKELEQERAATDGKIQTAVYAERKKGKEARDQLTAEHNAELGKLHTQHQSALSAKDGVIAEKEGVIQKKIAELQQKDTIIAQKDREVQQAIRGNLPMIRFCGLTIPEMMKSLVILIALIGLVAGLLAGGLTGGFIGYAIGKPEETTVPTVPVDTTEPSASTAPTETIPVQTTVPTVPATLFQEDGEINWDFVYNHVYQIRSMAFEPAEVEALLNTMGITAEGYAGDLEAVMGFTSNNTPVFMTVQKVPAQQDVDQPAADPEVQDQTSDDDEMQDTETEPSEPELAKLGEMVPAVVLDNGDYRIEAFYGKNDGKRHDAAKAAHALFCMLTEDTAEVAITGTTDAGQVLDIHALMIEVSGNELWWKNGFELDLDQNERYLMKEALDTSSEPIMLIHFEDGTEALLYDYSKKTSKRKSMVGILEGKGYAGAYVDAIVIGLSAKEETTEPTGEQSGQSTDGETQENT